MPLEIYCFASLITSMCPYWGRLPDLLFAMEFKIFRLKHVCLHWNGNTVAVLGLKAVGSFE